MNVHGIDEFEQESDDYTEEQDTFCEGNRRNKLECRRRIEELAEKKMLDKELSDYDF